ncbi:lytic transglycosylase domain-containing protein [Entomobacter blattae]|uniref:Uncharacterized protein n=1 Tax=Entomobacter blattae TaxID=2762277 RepID=A0A7H1NPD6_9PROT|nr:lytic transglycosylase domain-containing protein [Entomobacter blattae]QNT77646.1 hypothetical protein JGUZn3_03950 [Entomobacter blattae]
MLALYIKCMAMVAALHHFPPRVLPSIYQVEGGQVGTVHNNANNTQDLGVMQVNTRWIVPLMQATGTSGREVYTRLRDDACYNIAAAGAILDQYRQEAKGNMLRAIGYYHSHTPLLGSVYQLKVILAAEGRRLPKATAAGVSSGGVQGSAGRLSPYQRRLRKAGVQFTPVTAHRSYKKGAYQG